MLCQPKTIYHVMISVFFYFEDTFKKTYETFKTSHETFYVHSYYKHRV